MLMNVICNFIHLFSFKSKNLEALMKKFLLFVILFTSIYSFGNSLTGYVKDDKNNILPFASILIKGTLKGTTANAQGKYILTINAGTYTIVCQSIGYKTEEKTITINKETETLDFVLTEQQYTLKEVIVKNNGEDPAYAIIRNAIAKREEHLTENKKFECEVYLKGQLQLRNYPKKFFGETVDFEDGDTSKRKMIFLSETVAKYSVDGKNNRKIEVLSTRVSGQSDGFGFSSPQIISFYDNNISLGRGLNPRGFISPIANNALNYYKYKFAGTFFENGKMINKIIVTPKRSYEPLFTGTINIVEEEWRLQSVQLMCLKNQQMQFLDTLLVEQLYMPYKNSWVVKQQVAKPAGKFFGFDFFGSFLQAYDKYNIEPTFAKNFFDETLLKFYDSSNKKSKKYWDEVRPIPLSEAETRDYVKKDSLEQVRKDPRYLDSIDRKNNKLTLTKFLLTGININKEKKKSNISIDPLISNLTFNTVEGLSMIFGGSYFKELEGRKRLTISPYIRYGFSNTRLQAYANIGYNFGKKYINRIDFGGGKNVFQFDNSNPISSFVNTVSTLQYTRNHMKLYEAWFAKANYSAGLGKGLSIGIGANLQHRTPLENTTDYKWRTVDNRVYTDNRPIGFANITKHQALSLGIGLVYRPGTKYIEFPDRKVNIGSKYPTFALNITQGVPNLFGSDVDYTKWQFSVSDDLNMKLGGLLKYRFKIGGFLNSKSVFLPDFNHFTGSEVAFASPFLNSYQLMPYYSFSNTNKFYSAAHFEYHLNGLLTNKIPGFKKLNWFLVVGANTLTLDDSRGYYEAFVGLENIFKVMRVDFIKSFPKGMDGNFGVRLSVPFVQ